jgi:DNA mismatch repair protein MutS
MAGLPSQALDNYVTKLLAAGKKVAICDQAEPAKAGKDRDQGKDRDK